MYVVVDCGFESSFLVVRMPNLVWLESFLFLVVVVVSVDRDFVCQSETGVFNPETVGVDVHLKVDVVVESHSGTYAEVVPGMTV